MDHEIIWTEEATADFDAVITYLTGTTSDTTVRKFVSAFYRKLDLLAGMPYMGVKSQKREGVRRERGHGDADYSLLRRSQQSV